MRTKNITGHLSFIVALGCISGCMSSSPARKPEVVAVQMDAKTVEIRTAEIRRIKSEFGCNVDSQSAAMNFLQAFLRDSNSYEVNPIDSRAYRNLLERDMNVADKYISPSYKRKHYISPQTSLIEDAYGDKRPPEIICLKQSTSDLLEARVLTYWAKEIDYAAVDRIMLSNEDGNYYLLPSSNPRPTSPDASAVYARVGLARVPSNEIRITHSIFKQRP